MPGEMVGELVERALNRHSVFDHRRCPKRSEPGGALAVVGEKTMHIGPCNASVRRDRAIDPPVSEAQERALAVGTARPADMHFVTLERRAVGDALARDVLERLVPG